MHGECLREIIYERKSIEGMPAAAEHAQIMSGDNEDTTNTNIEKYHLFDNYL